MRYKYYFGKFKNVNNFLGLIFRREKYLMKTARFSSVFEKDNWKKSEDSTKVSFYREVVFI